MMMDLAFTGNRGSGAGAGFGELGEPGEGVGFQVGGFEAPGPIAGGLAGDVHSCF